MGETFLLDCSKTNQKLDKNQEGKDNDKAIIQQHSPARMMTLFVFGGFGDEELDLLTVESHSS